MWAPASAGAPVAVGVAVQAQVLALGVAAVEELARVCTGRGRSEVMRCPGSWLGLQAPQRRSACTSSPVSCSPPPQAPRTVNQRQQQAIAPVLVVLVDGLRQQGQGHAASSGRPGAVGEGGAGAVAPPAATCGPPGARTRRRWVHTARWHHWRRLTVREGAVMRRAWRQCARAAPRPRPRTSIVFGVGMVSPLPAGTPHTAQAPAQSTFSDVCGAARRFHPLKFEACARCAGRWGVWCACTGPASRTPRGGAPATSRRPRSPCC